MQIGSIKKRKAPKFNSQNEMIKALKKRNVPRVKELLNGFKSPDDGKIIKVDPNNLDPSKRGDVVAKAQKWSLLHLALPQSDEPNIDSEVICATLPIKKKTQTTSRLIPSPHSKPQAKQVSFGDFL